MVPKWSPSGHQVVPKWSPSGQWIVAVISFQKIYGLHGLEHHEVEINGDVTLGHIRTYTHVNIVLEFCKMLTELAKTTIKSII